MSSSSQLGGTIYDEFGDNVPAATLENDPVVSHARKIETTTVQETEEGYQNLSKLLRASLFPGAISKFPHKSKSDSPNDCSPVLGTVKE